MATGQPTSAEATSTEDLTTRTITSITERGGTKEVDQTTRALTRAAAGTTLAGTITMDRPMAIIREARGQPGSATVKAEELVECLASLAMDLLGTWEGLAQELVVEAALLISTDQSWRMTTGTRIFTRLKGCMGRTWFPLELKKLLCSSRKCLRRIHMECIQVDLEEVQGRANNLCLANREDFIRCWERWVVLATKTNRLMTIMLVATEVNQKDYAMRVLLAVIHIMKVKGQLTRAGFLPRMHRAKTIRMQVRQ